MALSKEPLRSSGVCPWTNSRGDNLEYSCKLRYHNFANKQGYILNGSTYVTINAYGDGSYHFEFYNVGKNRVFVQWYNRRYSLTFDELDFAVNPSRYIVEVNGYVRVGNRRWRVTNLDYLNYIF